MQGTRLSTTNTVQQVVRNGGFDIECDADTGFPLFSPEGEREWIKTWNPQPVFPEKIVFQRDTVFREGEQEAIWTILDVDWQKHLAEYVRVAPGSHTAHIIVQVDPSTPEHCKVAVGYTVTAFGERASSLLEAFSEEAFTTKMRNWQHQISESLKLRKSQ